MHETELDLLKAVARLSLASARLQLAGEEATDSHHDEVAQAAELVEQVLEEDAKAWKGSTI